MQQLRGRNALITGAAGGLGEYIARSLAAEGVNLVLSDLDEAGLDQRASQLRRRHARAEGRRDVDALGLPAHTFGKRGA